MKITVAPLMCSHLQHLPAFDQDAAEHLTVAEIRKRWPRFEGICSGCGKRLIMYASAEHYVYGDW
jgi:hypothetical protein